MNTCATCKYWKDLEQPSQEIAGLKECSRVVQYWDATKWATNGESRVLLEEYAEATAFVQDGSDYSAGLLTLPSFGCTQWELKDEQSQAANEEPRYGGGSE